MKFQYKDEYKYPTHIMLNVTDACNLACRYCFVEQHPHYMTLDIAKKAVDWTYKNYMIKKSKKLLLYKDEKPDINFFGGEPMLMYNSIIVPLIEYIEKKYPNIFTFGMTTNCTLLTQESIDFFYEHRMGHILCSIDGAEKTQCYNRPCKNGDNSSKLIEKNIKYLLEKFPQITFRSTGYAPTINNLFENYLYAEKLGFKKYAICLDERYKWTNEQINNLEQEISKIFLYRLKQRISGQTYMRFSCYHKLEHIAMSITNNQLLKYKNTILRCGLGTTSCAIGWDGKIYGCQQDVSYNIKNIMFIGDLNKNGINKRKHIKLLKQYIYNLSQYPYSKESCQSCILLQNYCSDLSQSNCPSSSLELFNTFGKTTQIKCIMNQLLFKQFLLTNHIYLDSIITKE